MFRMLNISEHTFLPSERESEREREREQETQTEPLPVLAFLLRLIHKYRSLGSGNLC